MSLDTLTRLLGIPDVQVSDYELPDDKTIVVDVKLGTPVAICPTCKKESTTIHSYGERRTIRDLGIWERKSSLRFRPRRFECSHCQDTFVERLTWLETRQHQTRRFEKRVYELIRRANAVEAAIHYDLTDDLAEDIFLKEASRRVEERGYPKVKALHVDEIAARKGWGEYYLVLSSPGLDVLDVLENRLKDTFEAWLDDRGPEWCAAVEEFHADMWKQYHEVARAKLPNVHTTTVDHFHVIQSLNDALADVRRTIQRTADKDTSSKLKGSRWLLVKNKEDLSPGEQERLESVLQASSELKTNYELKEDFRAIYALADRDKAEQRLPKWISQARKTGHPAMQKFVTTVENWQDEILSFFDGRGCNSFAEGLNNKIKLVSRRAYGYHKFSHFRLRILVAFDS